MIDVVAVIVVRCDCCVAAIFWSVGLSVCPLVRRFLPLPVSTNLFCVFVACVVWFGVVSCCCVCVDWCVRLLVCHNRGVSMVWVCRWYGCVDGMGVLMVIVVSVVVVVVVVTVSVVVLAVVAASVFVNFSCWRLFGFWFRTVCPPIQSFQGGRARAYLYKTTIYFRVCLDMLLVRMPAMASPTILFMRFILLFT